MYDKVVNFNHSFFSCEHVKFGSAGNMPINVPIKKKLKYKFNFTKGHKFFVELNENSSIHGLNHVLETKHHMLER